MKTFATVCVFAVLLVVAQGQGTAFSLTDLGFTGPSSFSNVFNVATLPTANDATALALFDGSGGSGNLGSVTFATLPVYGSNDDIFALNLGAAQGSSISGGSIADVNGNNAPASGTAAQAISAQGDDASASSVSVVGFQDLPNTNAAGLTGLGGLGGIGGVGGIGGLGGFPGILGRKILNAN